MAKPTRTAAQPPPTATIPAAAPLGDALFRALFEHLPNPAYIWRRTADGDFELMASNRAAHDVPFSKVEDLIGRRASELQRHAAHDLLTDLRQALATRGVVQREVEHRYLATGAARTLALTIMPVCGTIAVLHTEDVTEQRAAERALRDSERKYRQIVDTAHDGIWATDADGFTTYANERMAEMLGYRAEEMLGKATLDFVDPALHEAALASRAHRREGAYQQFDFKLRHKDGSDVWVSISASPVLDDEGRYAGTIGMVSDVRARRRAEQALRESEMRTRALLDANPDMIIRVSRDGTYLDVRARSGTETFLPMPAQAFIGRKVEELFDAEFARQHEKYRHAALETGQLQLWEYVRSFNGHVRHNEARFVKSGDDEVVATVRDITERVALEQAVIASVERERERVGHDLHDGLAQLLTGIKLLLEPLKEKLAQERSRHRPAVERTVELVGQAIADTRELARGLSPIPRSATFTDALRELAEQCERLLGVRCQLEEDTAPAQLNEAAAMHIYRIAQEAITNAARHGRASSVRLACTASDDRLTLTVTDDGVGIAPSAAADEHGLGLKIMHYRARSIGGELAVAERLGGGTVVTLTCPLAAAAL